LVVPRNDARRHGPAKRGGALAPVSLDETTLVADQRADALVALDEALTTARCGR